MQAIQLTDFDEKLRKVKNKVTSNKTRHAASQKKLNGNFVSSKQVINYLSGKVKLISTKRLTEDLKNGYINGAKYFVEWITKSLSI